MPRALMAYDFSCSKFLNFFSRNAKDQSITCFRWLFPYHRSPRRQTRRFAGIRVLSLESKGHLAIKLLVLRSPTFGALFPRELALQVTSAGIRFSDKQTQSLHSPVVQWYVSCLPHFLPARWVNAVPLRPLPLIVSQIYRQSLQWVIPRKVYSPAPYPK